MFSDLCSFIIASFQLILSNLFNTLFEILWSKSEKFLNFPFLSLSLIISLIELSPIFFKAPSPKEIDLSPFSLSITKNGVNLVNDESIRDTMIDLHNYSAMALMLLDEK